MDLKTLKHLSGITEAQTSKGKMALKEISVAAKQALSLVKKNWSAIDEYLGEKGSSVSTDEIASALQEAIESIQKA